MQQIYSTSAPESPGQLWLPRGVALSLMPALVPPPSPPPSLQRMGLDRILVPPFLLELGPALASGSRHSPNTMELLPAWARGM